MIVPVVVVIFMALVVASAANGEGDVVVVQRRNVGDVAEIESCSATALFPRDLWDEEANLHSHPHVGPAKVLYINMTSSSTCTDPKSCARYMSMIKEQDVGNGLPDINYNFVVGFAGNVYTGRGFNCSASGLDRDEDEKERGMIVGIFGRKDRRVPPPPRAMAAVMNLVLCGMDNGSIVQDVKIRHHESEEEPCKGSLGDKIQRMITSAYGSGSAYNPMFECNHNETSLLD